MGSLSEPPSILGIVVVPMVPWPEVVQAQAPIIHGINCRRGMEALLAVAKR